VKKVKLGHKLIGEGEPNFIVFEGGGTHEGLEYAKKLVKAAAESGADAIKFQYVDSDRLYAKKDITVGYTTPTGKKEGNRYEMSKRRMLKEEEWLELINYCKELGITFFSTACFPEDVDFLVESGSAAIKINAGDSDHYYLIDYASRKGVPIILDGRAKYDELERGVQICEGNGNKDIIIMHCPSGYPARNDAVNLRVIKTLREVFKYPIGFSDHSRDKLMNYPAIVLGADILEKTITLDKATESIEHFMSLEPPEAKEFVQEIRAIEEAMGTARVMFSTQINSGGRRGIVAKRDIPKGKVIEIDDLDFKRPGNFIPAGDYQNVLEKKAKKDFSKDEFLEYEHLE